MQLIVMNMLLLCNNSQVDYTEPWLPVLYEMSTDPVDLHEFQPENTVFWLQYSNEHSVLFLPRVGSGTL